MAAKKVVRVVAVQMLVADDPRPNLRRIQQSITKAATGGSDIVCLPEACLVNDHENAVPVDAYVDEIRARCRDLSVWCLFATYAREPWKSRLSEVV